jgi:glucose/arabinose dehydrogenase
MTVDARGRLWIAAAGLSTHGGDGVYLVAAPGDRPVRVIRGLEDPLGLVWLHGELYVSSVGRVSAFGGFNGRRFISSRTVLSGPVRRGENNGLAPQPSGRLAMGITATCDHCRPKSKYSGAIVSFRADGRDLRLYASRIRAPVGLTYFPGTADLFVSMNQRDDLGTRTPGDWLAVVGPGTSWGFPDCYGQGGRSCAGVPAHLAVLDKHAAVGPVVIVTGQLGRAVGPSLLVSDWGTGVVYRLSARAG